MLKRWASRRFHHIPEAGGEISGLTSGRSGTAPALRLGLLGDSAGAGVGAATHQEALVGQTAEALTGLTGRPVSWRVSARSGATVRTIMRRGLLDALAVDSWRADIVLVVAGSNDAIRMRRPRVFRRDTAELITAIRDRLGHDVPVMLAGVPPFERFPGLPRPARWSLGVYSRQLNRQLARLSRRVPLVFHLPVGDLAVEPSTAFSMDDFHPSPIGYRVWGRSLAAQMATLLEQLPCEASDDLSEAPSRPVPSGS